MSNRVMSNRAADRAAADRAPHHVVVLVLPGVYLLDLGIPLQAFGPDSHYRVTLCADVANQPVPSTGLVIDVPRGIEALDDADTVVVPGYEPPTAVLTTTVLDGLRFAYRRGARMMSICTGAFALAAAGILDGRPATTHWRDAATLQRLYPSVGVNPNLLFVDDGNVLTSAGVAAGIDLCLHVVRRDYGSACASARARVLVAAPRREGGQSQFIERFLPEPGVSDLAGTRAWMVENLAQPLDLDTVARHANMSRRHFVRRFRSETGTSPLRWLTAARIDRARELLETTDLAVERVGELCGLGGPANVREIFRRHVGIAPRDYRKMFAQSEPGELK